MACFFEGIDGLDGPGGAGGGAGGGPEDDGRLFVVDATAHDEEQAGPCGDGGVRSVIHLYTKTRGGVARTVHWVGEGLVFYLAWPAGADLSEFQDRLSRRVRHGLAVRLVRRSPLMGFLPDPDGSRRTQNFVQVTVPSQKLRRAVAYACRPGNLVDACVDDGVLPPGARDTGLEVLHDRVCPVQQAMVRHGGAPGMWVSCARDGDGETHRVVFHPDDDAPPPPLRCLSFDIETSWARGQLRPGAFPQPNDPAGRITHIGMTYLDGPDRVVDRVLCLGATTPPEGVDVVCFDDEAALLEGFAADVSAMDPDVVSGYNIHGFDVGWLCARAELIGVFRAYGSAAEVQRDWAWARSLKARFPAKAPRDEIRDWLRAEGRARLGCPAGWDTRPSGVCLDVAAHRLASYRTSRDAVAAWGYFRSLRRPSGFWRCGRHGDRVCALDISTSKTGADQQRLDMEGRLCVDLYTHVREQYASKFKSFSLKNVATFFDPTTPKIDLDYHLAQRHYETGDPGLCGVIAEYCSRDCVIPARLCHQLDVWQNLLEMSRVTGVPASQITRRGQQVRCMAQLYRLCERRGLVMNVRRETQAGTYRGAVVQTPRRGYYDRVIIYEDFASLYPNIMRSYNLCYSTYVYQEDVARLGDAVEVVEFPADPRDAAGFEAARARAEAAARPVVRVFPMDDGRRHHFVQARAGPNLGCVPELLDEVLAARKRAKRAMAAAADVTARRVQNARQLSLKICANSMYGFTGVPSDIAMLPLSAVAETTTALGRYLITLCADIVPRAFPRVTTLVYGDTDSVIFETDTADLAEGHAVGVEVERWLNEEVLPRHGHALQIECEEICSPSLWIMKKRYISRAFTGPQDDGHVEYKGIELVRKDSLPFCNRLYAGIIDLVFGSGIGPRGPAKTKAQIADDVVAYLTGEFRQVYDRTDRYGMADFTLSKTLQNRSRYKNPDALPHVRLAQRINDAVDRGEMSREKFHGGQQIAYVIRRGSGPVADRVALEEEVPGGLDGLDMLHYLDQTRRALNKVTAFFLAPAVEDALYETIRSTLFLRQHDQGSLLDEATRVDVLGRNVARALVRAGKDAGAAGGAADGAPRKKMRQRTLFETL